MQALTFGEQLDDIFAKGIKAKAQEISHALEKVNALVQKARK